MMVAGRGLRQGADEVIALEAINELTDPYIYIDYLQVFPDTYRFDEPRGKIFDRIIQLLKSQGEVILKQEGKDGIIFTAAKEAPLSRRENETLEIKDRIYYQQSIFITSKDSGTTYVTNYPTVLKGHHQEIVIPMGRNLLRGMFFGKLAADLYPEMKRKGLIAARERGIEATNVDDHVLEFVQSKPVSSDGVIIHKVAPGETLGAISKQYTGNVMNYRKIADFNGIDDVTKIKVGQEIRIPKDI
jgi:hypothetical protein